MKHAAWISLLTMAAAISVAGAAPPDGLPTEQSMDAPRRGKRPPRIPNMPEAALAPGSEDVGDGDSFGRSVKFLGYAQTYGISIQHDCTGWEPGTCAVTDGTSFVTIEKFDDAAVIRLPADAARSLLCFTTTPLGFVAFHNPSGARENASASLLARWRIESDVLNDPSLINSNTGEPFNGVIESSDILATESFSIEPGAHRTVTVNHSRTCNSGNLRRSTLVQMGLSEAQAREVFRRPITLRFGSRMSMNFGSGGMSPGFRVYGD
jgi:hypothetical protein